MTWLEYQNRQKIAELADGFMSYAEGGREHNETLIFLHGIPTWGYMWKDYLHVFSRTRRVIVPDLMGYGFSDKRDVFDRSLARQASYLVELMDQLQVKSATFIAHDLGGGLALRLATEYASRVDRLVLVNTVSYDSWPIELMLQLGHPRVERALPTSAVRQLLKWAMRQGFTSRPSGELLDDILRPYSTETGKLSLIRNASALNTNLTTELTPKLPSMQAPTLLLWGVDDRFQPSYYARRLQDDIPNCELVRIEGARHFVMLEQPQQMIREISRFLVQNPIDKSQKPAIGTDENLSKPKRKKKKDTLSPGELHA